MAKREKKQIVDLSGGITFLEQLRIIDGKQVRYIEGRLKKNKDKRYGLDVEHELKAGSRIELRICGVWIKTVIRSEGKKYFAEGLKGLPLDGLTARIFIK